MAEYRLHCFAQSGNAYKPALTLALAGADWEPVWVDFFHGGTRRPEFRAINEMGEVPVLEHGALRLSQSGVILDYLAGSLGRFGPESERAARDPALDALGQPQAHLLHRHLPLDAELPARGEARPGGARLARRPGAGGDAGARRASRRARTGSSATGMTTADLSCIGYLYFTDEFGVDIIDYLNIGRWRDAIAALPGWKHPYELMPGHPLPATA